MSDLAEKGPMTIVKILDLSFSFIFKNISWILPFGFIIAFFELLASRPIDLFGSQYKWLFLAMSISLLMLLFGTVAVLLGGHFYGRDLAWSEGFKKSLKKWMPILLLQIFITMVMVLGFILLVIPGIIVACATAFVIPVMMIEDLKPMKAFDRSWSLSKKHRLRIFGYLILNVIAVGVAEGIIKGITSQLSLSPLFEIGLSALLKGSFYAFGPTLFTLLYFDLRIRKEALDLEEESNTISVVTMQEG